MKIRPETINVDFAFRRRLNMSIGKPGLASRWQVKEWFDEHAYKVERGLMADTQDAFDAEVKEGKWILAHEHRRCCPKASEGFDPRFKRVGLDDDAPCAGDKPVWRQVIIEGA